MDPFLIDAGIGLLTFFLGLFLGNWLAIGRDKRRERNEAIIPVRAKLVRARKSVNPFNSGLTLEELDLLTCRLPWLKRSRFRNALTKYQETCEASEQRTSSGDVYYSNTKEINRQIDGILKKFLSPN